MEEEELRTKILWDLGGMRLEREFDEGDIKMVKKATAEWLESSSVLAARKLEEAGLLAPGAAAADVCRVMQADIFNGIHTTKREVAARREMEQPLVPRVTDLSGGNGRDPEHIVASFNPLDMIEQRLQRSPAFRKAFLAESERLKSGEGYRTPPPSVLRGYKDGVGARYHPHLMRPATPNEVHDVRGALEFNCDDVEVRCAPARPCTARPCKPCG